LSLRDLSQWLLYQEQAYPRAVELGLERLSIVLQRLNWRRPDVPVITIAGTNGKGSVAAYTASILQAAGFRAGLFTSPHLRDYRERIRIHDRYADAGSLVAAFERIEAARGDVGLTFFEYNTLAVLLLFEAAELDAWVLEIGLGGRLDAVNLVDPDVAVVVSIGLDHQEFLGNSLEQIGAEKAGIFRRGRPAILGSIAMPSSVERVAIETGARLKRLGREFTAERNPVQGRWHFHGTTWDLADLPPPSLYGATQFDNAATSLAALEEISGRLALTPAAIAEGLTRTRLAGRFQIFRSANERAPTWILDVAHNPAAARVLAQNLRALPTLGRTIAVFGVLADKDERAIVAELADLFDHWWFATTEGARGLRDADAAARVADLVGGKSSAGGSFASACESAQAMARGADRIVAFGSFHSVGPVLDWLESRVEYNADTR
jgi:dihydrofolate synthase/folylpolyglutamate synthase